MSDHRAGIVEFVHQVSAELERAEAPAGHGAVHEKMRSPGGKKEHEVGINRELVQQLAMGFHGSEARMLASIEVIRPLELALAMAGSIERTLRDGLRRAEPPLGAGRKPSGPARALDAREILGPKGT